MHRNRVASSRFSVLPTKYKPRNKKSDGAADAPCQGFSVDYRYRNAKGKGRRPVHLPSLLCKFPRTNLLSRNRFLRHSLKFSTDLGKRIRIFLLEELNQFFAHETAQVPSRAGIAGIHERSELKCMFGGVADLKDTNFALPQFCGFQNAAQLRPDLLDRDGVINVEKDS